MKLRLINAARCILRAILCPKSHILLVCPDGCCATEMRCGECIAEWLEREVELPFSSLEESTEELA